MHRDLRRRARSGRPRSSRRAAAGSRRRRCATGRTIVTGKPVSACAVLQRLLGPPLGAWRRRARGSARSGVDSVIGVWLHRLGVDRAGADVHVLLGARGRRSATIRRASSRVVGQEVDHRVERPVAERRGERRPRRRRRRDQPSTPSGRSPLRGVVAAVEHGDAHPALDREPHAGGADRAGAAEVEDAEPGCVVVHHRSFLRLRSGRRTSPRSRSRRGRSGCPAAGCRAARAVDDGLEERAASWRRYMWTA